MTNKIMQELNHYFHGVITGGPPILQEKIYDYSLKENTAEVSPDHSFDESQWEEVFKCLDGPA